MEIHRVTSIISISLAPGLGVGVAEAVKAQSPPDAPRSGFYGGVSMRDKGTESTGITLGNPGMVWNHFAIPTIDDSASRSLLFGGYRWGNDIAVEASFSSADKYALQPPEGPAARRGVGLNFGSSASNLGELPAKIWNLDVFTSWNFYKAFALYGRVGYAQSDTAASLGMPLPTTPDIRRLARDGVNYGLGLRYDMTHSLGLRVEYARFGRFAGEVVNNGLPESDQVSIGVQFRF